MTMPFKPKEAGYIVSIDQASNAAGCSVWKDGQLLATTTLLSNSKKDSLGARLVAQVSQLTDFLSTIIPKDDEVKIVLFEGVKSSLVMTTIGAFVTCPYLQNCKVTQRNSFIHSGTWKAWARDRGAQGKFGDIKGIKALTECGWDFVKYPLKTDDEADSCMLYCAWRDSE